LDPPNYINTTPFHPLAYLTTTNPSPFFSHLSFHLHISNDLVSSPPTYLPTHPSIYQVTFIYLPIYPYTPTNVLHNTSVKKCWLNHMRVLQSMWHHQRTKFNEGIAFHHVNDCVILPLSYLLATPSRYLPDTTQPYLLAWYQYDQPPISHRDVQIKKYRYCISFGLFTQATCNAHMKIIATTQIQVFLTSNNSHHFTFIFISHPSKYLPDTTWSYLLARSLVWPTPPFAHRDVQVEKM